MLFYCYSIQRSILDHKWKRWQTAEELTVLVMYMTAIWVYALSLLKLKNTQSYANIANLDRSLSHQQNPPLAHPSCFTPNFFLFQLFFSKSPRRSETSLEQILPTKKSTKSDSEKEEGERRRDVSHAGLDERCPTGRRRRPWQCMRAGQARGESNPTRCRTTR